MGDLQYRHGNTKIAAMMFTSQTDAENEIMQKSQKKYIREVIFMKYLGTRCNG
jgi:hypothetical protein